MQFVKEAFESNYIAPLGPMVDAFERDFAKKIGIPYTVALCSGTASMHLALHVLGVRGGDEVFVSSLTFIGSISPVTFLGGIPVFIDADEATWNMNPKLLAQELATCKERGKLPKAVIPTDLYGQCADYEKILGVCKDFGVPVIADSAEALGAKRKLKSAHTQTVYHSQGRQNSDTNEEEVEVHAGFGAKAAVFSFNGNKIITTSGGGMLASEDAELIERARFLSQQARDPFSHYEHSEIGYNYRMSNILASIGRGQLRVLNERVKRKREIFDFYQRALGDISGIAFMPEAAYGTSSRWLTVILITPNEFGASREEVRLALEAENIESRPVWKPMHKQPVFQIACWSEENKTNRINNRFRARKIGGEVAEDLFKRGLCLPSGTSMTEEDIDRVIKIIKRSVGKHKKNK
ncbi:MAG: DegT/DnrJ/EryC1/StrS family aminotransferase [Thermodesulfobacteriota bacterium]|nr:DegT/DnrJ/EryC1/StrS family aminotransferase [Thermodesulfobacteriota bacterium]